ncbi:MAG: peptidylprolyl isomerase [Lachnospiraceae bacterium]|nr:peptidylprolyl isomerase [Ruminococcus sp.]MCM1275309.1 peptidylprolyl isomerase [Lachnospiraceae bacterium]
MKKIFAALSAVIMAALTGCSAAAPNGMLSYDFAAMSMDFVQLSLPKDGDTIAVFDTDYGEIRVVLYEEYAPVKVASFIEKANAGDYDNMEIKGVSNDVYFLTGGYENSKGQYIGRDDNAELLANEYTPELWPFRGALMGFSEQSGSSDARWFMCWDDDENLTVEAVNELKSGASGIEDEQRRDNMLALFDKFYEVGGVFGMAGEFTVFGQTYLGFDVVEKLTHIPADDSGQATSSVLIKSVTISEFKDGDETDEFPFAHPEGLPEESASDGQSGE